MAKPHNGKISTMKDRILFWIDNSLAYFGVAKSLKENYDCELYAIYDMTDRTRKFFENQDLVFFQKTWFYHDNVKKNEKKLDLEYLASFEKKYKINLWLLAYNERIFYEFNKFYKFSTDEVLSILEQECKFFERILDEIKPNFLIMFLPFFHHDNLFYRLGKKKGIRCLLHRVERMNSGRSGISEEDESFSYSIPKSSAESDITIEELQNKLKETYAYDEITRQKLYRQSNIPFLKAALQFLFYSRNTNIKTHYTYYGRTKLRVLFKTIFITLKTKYRKNFIDRNFSYSIQDNEPYIFFPLHMEEEMSLLVLAPFYTNQIEVIKHIVKSLPIGYKLVLKEHSHSYFRDWRSISEYKKLIALPNVVMLHPDVRPDEIIKNCSLVITISGTASLEAAFYKKPSIIFVETPFSLLPSVHRVKSIDELPDAIRTSLRKEVKISDLKNYVDYVEKNSFKFNVYEFWKKHEQYFLYSGKLADVDIPIQKMKIFLEKEKPMFDKLALEYIKKIKQYSNS